MYRFFATLISIFGTSIASATELEDLAGAYAECTAYYTIVYHAVNNAGETETAASYSKVMDNSMFYSLLLASENRDKDLAVKVTNSRIEMYIKQMKRETDNDNANISILINKHNFACQDLMENLPGELEDIINR